jgi:hypothetical protein
VHGYVAYHWSLTDDFVKVASASPNSSIPPLQPPPPAIEAKTSSMMTKPVPSQTPLAMAHERRKGASA